MLLRGFLLCVQISCYLVLACDNQRRNIDMEWWNGMQRRYISKFTFSVRILEMDEIVTVTKKKDQCCLTSLFHYIIESKSYKILITIFKPTPLTHSNLLLYVNYSNCDKNKHNKKVVPLISESLICENVIVSLPA